LKLRNSEQLNATIEEDNARLKQFIDKNTVGLFSSLKDECSTKISGMRADVAGCIELQGDSNALRDRMVSIFKQVQNKVNESSSKVPLVKAMD